MPHLDETMRGIGPGERPRSLTAVLSRVQRILGRLLTWDGRAVSSDPAACALCGSLRRESLNATQIHHDPTCPLVEVGALRAILRRPQR